MPTAKRKRSWVKMLVSMTDSSYKHPMSKKDESSYCDEYLVKGQSLLPWQTVLSDVHCAMLLKKTIENFQGVVETNYPTGELMKNCSWQRRSQLPKGQEKRKPNANGNGVKMMSPITRATVWMMKRSCQKKPSKQQRKVSKAASILNENDQLWLLAGYCITISGLDKWLSWTSSQIWKARLISSCKNWCSCTKWWDKFDGNWMLYKDERMMAATVGSL